MSFAETLRRHATRPRAAGFTPEEMAGWYVEYDLLGVPGEQVIRETSPFDGTVEFILTTSGGWPRRPSFPTGFRRSGPVGRLA